VAWSVCIVPLCLRHQKCVGNEEPRFIEVYAPVNLFKCMLMLFFLIYEQGAVNDGDEQQEQVG
jgi:hypothetical protein